MIHSYTYKHSEKEKVFNALYKVARFIKDHPAIMVIEMIYRCSDNGFVVYYINRFDKDQRLKIRIYNA
jgi:hypothetical protein